jgi:hypothetical protein
MSAEVDDVSISSSSAGTAKNIVEAAAYLNFRKKFNQEMFGCTFVGDDTISNYDKGMCSRNDTAYSRTKYANFVQMLRDRDEIGEGDDKESKRLQGQKATQYGTRFYDTTLSLATQTFPDGTSKDIIKRKTKNDIWLPVLKEEETFDAIRECHQAVGHKAIGQTKQEATNQFANVTREMVKIFCQLCPVCLKKSDRKKITAGARNPIDSLSFRDRFQCDLIDMQANPQKDHNGILMHWIIVVKDHFTKFTWLRAVARKKTNLVAAELDQLFGFIGYPLIYHSDNGKEVAGKQIVNLLKSINPNVITVTGRARTPSDQGSVERGNREIKKVLSALEDSQ